MLLPIAGQSPLKRGQLLSEDDCRDATNKYGTSFKAFMGAEAIKSLLENLDLEVLGAQLRQVIAKTNSKQKIKDLTKRLKISMSSKTAITRRSGWCWRLFRSYRRTCDRWFFWKGTISPPAT